MEIKNLYYCQQCFYILMRTFKSCCPASGKKKKKQVLNRRNLHIKKWFHRSSLQSDFEKWNLVYFNQCSTISFDINSFKVFLISLLYHFMLFSKHIIDKLIRFHKGLCLEADKINIRIVSLWLQEKNPIRHEQIQKVIKYFHLFLFFKIGEKINSRNDSGT